jgi:ABC-type nitrate/sulfonate/bicarbonate transport system substrate-binding protein
VTLDKIPLVLVLKNLRLLKGGLKREQGFSVVRNGEAASSNKDAAEKFVEKFKENIQWMCGLHTFTDTFTF